MSLSPKNTRFFGTKRWGELPLPNAARLPKIQYFIYTLSLLLGLSACLRPATVPPAPLPPATQKESSPTPKTPHPQAKAKAQTQTKPASTTDSLPNAAPPLVSLPLRLSSLSWLAPELLALGRIGIRLPIDPQQSPTQELQQSLHLALDTRPASPQRALPLFLSFALRQLPWTVAQQLQALKQAGITPLEGAWVVTAKRELALLWPLPPDPQGIFRRALARAFGGELILRADHWRLQRAGTRGEVLGLSAHKTLLIFLSPVSDAAIKAFLRPSPTPAPPWFPAAPRPGSQTFELAWVGQHLLESAREEGDRALPVVGQLQWSGNAGSAMTVNGASRDTK